MIWKKQNNINNEIKSLKDINNVLTNAVLETAEISSDNETSLKDLENAILELADIINNK